MEQRLRRTVLDRLHLLGEQAMVAEPGRLASLARTEIRRMTDGWRTLLAEHQPDEEGRCLDCMGWFRHRRWPCDVWLTVHQHLIGEGTWYRPRRKPSAGFGRRAPSAAIEAVPRRHPDPPAAPAGTDPTITAVPHLADLTLVPAPDPAEITTEIAAIPA